MISNSNICQEQLYENAPCGFFTASLNGEIKHANKAFFSLLAVDGSNGLHIESLFCLNNQKSIGVLFPSLLHLGALSNVECWAISTKIPVVASLFIQNDEDQLPTYIYGVVINNSKQYHLEEPTDVEEKHYTEIEQLKRANATLSEFAYALSHDLKEPLRSIKSTLWLMQKRSKNVLDEKSQQFMQVAVDNASRMEALIQNVLDFSITSEIKGKTQPLVLNDIMEAVKQHLACQISETNALILIPDLLPTVVGYPTGVLRVLQNLVSNAIKFVQKGQQPVVTIVAEEKPTYWVICVKDNGLGIDENHQAKIFEIFKRLHASADYAGSGVGLSLCKKIVEQHGGNIWVESKLGAGSNFYFTLNK